LVCRYSVFNFRVILPNTGQSFTGAAIYTEFGPNYLRETFGQSLPDTLQAGHKYCVSFYVSLAESSHFAIDRIGALFTSSAIDGSFVFSFTSIPQVENPIGNIIADTSNWILISGDFIAQGNESYVSIGNFYNDQNTQALQLPFGDTISKYTYYYFDDISVIDCTVGLNEYQELNSSVYPNPINSGQDLTLTFDSAVNEIETVNIYSVEGKKIHSHDIELTGNKISLKVNFEPGIYFCKVESKMGTGIRKIVVL
jgi:Secretion system C-terminal sorting domain